MISFIENRKDNVHELKQFEIIDEDIVDFVNFAHALGKKPKSAYMY